jgi:hypothetical protein
MVRYDANAGMVMLARLKARSMVDGCSRVYLFCLKLKQAGEKICASLLISEFRNA